MAVRILAERRKPPGPMAIAAHTTENAICVESLRSGHIERPVHRAAYAAPLKNAARAIRHRNAVGYASPAVACGSAVNDGGTFRSPSRGLKVEYGILATEASVLRCRSRLQ
jgi:hypothetical protein